MENREKERKEIQRQEVELIKEVYVSSALFAYSSFKTLAYGFKQYQQDATLHNGIYFYKRCMFQAVPPSVIRSSKPTHDSGKKQKKLDKYLMQ